MNSLIVIPDKSSDEEEEEEEYEMTRVIKDNVDHVIQHDKEELSDLLMEHREADLLMDLRDEVGKEFLDAQVNFFSINSKRGSHCYH